MVAVRIKHGQPRKRVEGAVRGLYATGFQVRFLRRGSATLMVYVKP